MTVALWRRILIRLVGPWIYQARSERGPSMFTRWLQRRIESGRSLPIFWPADACRAFWQSRTNDPAHTGNRPEHYATKPTGLIDLIAHTPYLTPDLSIFEVGANCGANLRHLQQAGFPHVSGLEMNPHAIAEGRRRWPEIPIAHGDAARLGPDQYDVVLMIAVGMHIPPSESIAFTRIAAAARQYLITVELESASCAYVFPRDYHRVFRDRGWQQLEAIRFVQDWRQYLLPYTHQLVRYFLNDDDFALYGGYTLRIFAPIGAAQTRHWSETVKIPTAAHVRPV